MRQILDDIRNRCNNDATVGNCLGDVVTVTEAEPEVMEPQPSTSEKVNLKFFILPNRNNKLSKKSVVNSKTRIRRKIRRENSNSDWKFRRGKFSNKDSAP